MAMPDGPQFNRPLTPQELIKPTNVFTAYKSPRDLEWDMAADGGISTKAQWESGLTENALKGNRGYLRVPGPTLRGNNG